MAGIRIKPASPASGSVTVSVVEVPNCPETRSAARMRSTGGSGGGSGAMLISIAAGTAGMGGTAAGDTRVSCRRVASGPGPGCETFVPGVRPLPMVTRGDWNDVDGSARIAAAGPRHGGRSRCRLRAPRPRPPTAWRSGPAERSCSRPQRPRDHLRRFRDSSAVDRDLAAGPDRRSPPRTSLTQFDTGRWALAPLPLETFLRESLSDCEPGPCLSATACAGLRTDDQQRRRDHAGSRREANSRVRHDPFPDQLGLPNPGSRACIVA